jgi:hypothetical protein
VIVIGTHTVGDGLVIRWYPDRENGRAGREVMSASRNGVLISTYLHLIPDEHVLAASAAYESLQRDRDADLSGLMTHRFKRFMSDEIEPIEKAATA